MEKQKEIPNWMTYSSMSQLYKQSQASESSLELDMKFLSDSGLGRYQNYLLDKLDLSQAIQNFLNQVGLPDRFTTWRSPDEEKEAKKQESYFGIIFSLRCLRIEEIKQRKFLIIGEERSLGRSSISCKSTDCQTWTWWKTEECT